MLRTMVRRAATGAPLHSRAVVDAIMKDSRQAASSDQLQAAAHRFVDFWLSTAEPSDRRQILLQLGHDHSLDRDAVDSALAKYQQTGTTSALRFAVAPPFQQLFKAIGNLPDGVKTVADLRAYALEVQQLVRREGQQNKDDVQALGNVEEGLRELLTGWFSLANLQLERLTWQSPADIIQKVAGYEAVHPVSGLLDLRRRLGPHRRCFYFSHPAMPREPLVIVHVALRREIADNIQEIVKTGEVDYDEGCDTAANYYSISSAQKGLAGIDLGNLLIKRVVRELQSDSPQIRIHSTLSPIPGLRDWLIGRLDAKHEGTCGELLDEVTVQETAKAVGCQATTSDVREALHKALSDDRSGCEELQHLKVPLQRLAAYYICRAKNPKSRYALNPVANFHLRNGAEVWRLNWGGDQSVRGSARSAGIMVNYRYRLDRVVDNAAQYVHKREIAIHERVQQLLPPEKATRSSL